MEAAKNLIHRRFEALAGERPQLRGNRSLGDHNAVTDSDAVQKYWRKELKPQTRLDYCSLSLAEAALLRAMCSFSTEGAAVDKSLDVLARRAGFDRRTAQRLMNGYKQGSRRVVGLKARGVVSELAPSQTKKAKPAVLRINWDALVLDPAKRHILIRRMQGALPGMQQPIDPEQSPSAVKDTSGKTASDIPACVKDVNFYRPPRQNVQGVQTQCPGPPGHDVQRSPDKMSPQESGFVLGSSGKSFVNTSPGAERGVVEIPAAIPEKSGVSRLSKIDFSNQKTRKPATYADLHPGLREKIKRELAAIMDNQLGLNTYGWSAQQHARRAANNMRLACDRAGIWPHVTDDLVQEQYEIALAEAKKEPN